VILFRALLPKPSKQRLTASHAVSSLGKSRIDLQLKEDAGNRRLHLVLIMVNAMANSGAKAANLQSMHTYIAAYKSS
jgi:hypothetical protein